MQRSKTRTFGANASRRKNAGPYRETIMSIATPRDKGCGPKLVRIMLVALIATLSAADHVQAQLVAPVPITLNYAFSVPIAKVVPNSCTGGFVLVQGTMKLS